MATAADPDGKIDIGRTLSRGFEAIGAQFPAYLLLSLLLAGIPTFVSSYLLGQSLEGPSFLSGVPTPGYWGSLFLSMLGGALLQAAIARSAILTLTDRQADIMGSVAGAFRLILPLIGLSLLSSIIIGFGLILLVVPGIIAYIALSVAVPVLVEERAGVTASMQRSADLTKGSRWRIFLLMLLLGFAYFMVTAVVGGLFIVLGGASSLIQTVLEACLAIFLALLMGTLVASIYVELRTVKEGAPADTLAAVFE